MNISEGAHDRKIAAARAAGLSDGWANDFILSPDGVVEFAPGHQDSDPRAVPNIGCFDRVANLAQMK